MTSMNEKLAAAKSIEAKGTKEGDVLVGPKADFLRRIVTGRGGLRGTDLETGETYVAIRAKDPDEFIRAHLLGPSAAEPPQLDVTTKAGERQRARAYTVTSVTPIDCMEACSHVSIQFTTNDALRPSEEVVAASQALSRAGVEHRLERSSSFGRWVFWVVRDEPMWIEQATSLATRLRGVMRLIGLADDSYEMPLLDAKASLPRLPFPFFSGNHFGVVYNVGPDGGLQALSIPPLPKDRDEEAEGDVPASSPVGQRDDEDADDVEFLLERWVRDCGQNESARSRDLIAFCDELSWKPAMLARLGRRAATKELDRRLYEMSLDHPGRFRIFAALDGKLNRYWIEDRSYD